MFKYTLHAHDFTAQAAHLSFEPASTGEVQTPAVDDAHNPTRVTVYTTTGAAAALRIAQRHLTLIHARRAYTDPDPVDRTAADIVYAQARSLAESLTPEQRKAESYNTIHGEDDALRLDALTDVMEERGELDT
ncbi:hypothetical protein OG883_42625 [Streptomyces sp. NBC_01142]|uniref:hypothetical protein n=1 Tax=Streptomyces sp. NBC_01142 TaxID=2975865 RepID=UPI0022561634|nr:hypothetical protein [Streptomyces sp. NBC_01142]MCX4826339.1 hypothetical protein [Streptomyces sp. NBC_01142]